MHLDPSLHSENAGDEIISEAVRQVLATSTDREFRRIPTHRRPPMSDLVAARRTEIAVVGGSNIIKSHLEKNRQWLITPDLVGLYAHRLVFLGVGWWQYQEPPCAYTRWALRTMSHPEALHSARDEYTAERLSALGLDVVYTNCPTTWQLRAAPGGPRTAEVVITITDYKRDQVCDEMWIRQVAGAYESVRLVAMSQPDLEYATSLAFPPNVVSGGVGLRALDEMLVDRDYIGTRLHAGIRGLQHGRNALILAVDNRAPEMARSSGLPVVSRDDREGLAHWLAQEWPERRIELPVANINAWMTSWRSLTSG